MREGEALEYRVLVADDEHTIANAIDENTMKLLPEVKGSYSAFVKKYPNAKTSQIVSAYLAEIDKNKDVIFAFGKQGESIIGDAKPNISTFWDEISSRVDHLF